MMLEAGADGCQGERMAHEGAGVEGDADLREGVVAILPRAAIERIHVGGAAGEDTDGQTARDDLAVGREVGANAVECLHAAGMGAEAGDHFVEDEAGAALLRDAANLAQEFDGTKLGMAALHRLDQHGGDFVGALANDFEALGGAVVEHKDIGYAFAGNAGRDRHGAMVADDLTSTSSKLP